MGARTDTFDTFGFGNSLPSETAKTVGPGTYLGGLWPSCPGGTSGWLWAASNHPPSGPSHDPLLLAVIDPHLRHHLESNRNIEELGAWDDYIV